MNTTKSVQWVLGLIIILSSLLIGYLLFCNNIKQDKIKLESKLNELFANKDAVTDGQNMPIDLSESIDQRDYVYLSGGFKVYELLKESDGFVKKEFIAGSLHFNQDKYTYFGYGYKSDNFRPSPETCYNNAFEILQRGSQKERKASYSPNKFVEIKNFPIGYVSDFFEIQIGQHPKESYQSIKLFGGAIGTPIWKVNYDQINTYYTIVKREQQITESLSLYLIGSITIGIFLLVFVKPLARYIQPNTGSSHSLFGKKWKKLSENFIISFDLGRLGNHSAMIIENGKIKKGTMNIKDNGASLHIMLQDSEYYFQISELTENTLVVFDLANENTIQFEVLGSGAISKKQQEKVISNESDQENGGEASQILT